MHIGKTDGPGFTCILAVIAYFYYLLNIYLFIYLFLSLLKLVVQLSQKRFGPPSFGPIIFFLSCLSTASRLHLITLTKEPWERRRGGTPGPKCPKKLLEYFFRPYSTSWSSYFFLRIETGHEVLDELIGRCCGELSIIIYGDALHGLSRIKRQ